MPRRMTTLPRSLDELRGRRCALWIRESTLGQYDNFGPDSQREQYDRAIGRYGLVETGLAWTVAASGWKAAWRTDAWVEMMAAAADGQFDVLVAAYASRFSRNLKQTLIAVEDHLHPGGVVVLFAAEKIVSSDPDGWDQFVHEAHEAESFSRKLSKRVAEGYAAKRRRLGVPGGNRPPFGTLREGRPSRLSVDEQHIATVRLAYDLSAAGLTDRQVAARTRLRLTHVHEVLTNDFYRGVLRTGEPSALGPLVDPALWDRVQTLRGRYSRQHRGSIRRRTYALSGLLVCGSCGRRITGHSGRYRHVDACAGFVAAAPTVRRAFSRNYDGRVRGESYKAEWYDGIVGAALRNVAVNAKLAAETTAKAVVPPVANPHPFRLARIKNDRESALAQYLRDRDGAALDATMRRLDQEEAGATAADTAGPTHEDVRDYLSNLSKLWDETEEEGRHAIAEAAFERIAVVGLDMVAVPSIEANRYGWAEYFGSGTLEVPIVCSIGHSGRGERDSPATNDLVVMRLAEPPEPCEWLRSA